MVVVILAITDKVPTSAQMPKLNDSRTSDLGPLVHQVLSLRIDALNRPVIALIALTIIAEPRNLISP